MRLSIKQQTIGGLKMTNSNINNLTNETSKVSKQNTLKVNKISIEDCNEWIKNNTQKIVNLYLRSILDQKKNNIQKSLNDLVKSERIQNSSRQMRPDSLEKLKELTKLNQTSFSNWKSESNITSSKIENISKRINSIQIESIDQFLERGGVITKIKNRKKKAN